MSPPSHDEHSQDAYWSLPEGRRAELIDGVLYDMVPPSTEHQALVVEISGELRSNARPRTISVKTDRCSCRRGLTRL